MEMEIKKVPATGEQQGLIKQYKNMDNNGIILLQDLEKDHNKHVQTNTNNNNGIDHFYSNFNIWIIHHYF